VKQMCCSMKEVPKFYFCCVQYWCYGVMIPNFIQICGVLLDSINMEEMTDMMLPCYVLCMISKCHSDALFLGLVLSFVQQL
jgi:hypothetical protein